MSTPDKSPPLGEVLEAIEKTKTELKSHIKLMENDDSKLDSPLSTVLDIYEVARDQGPKKQLLAEVGRPSDDRIVEDNLLGLKGQWHWPHIKISNEAGPMARDCFPLVLGDGKKLSAFLKREETSMLFKATQNIR